MTIHQQPQQVARVGTFMVNQHEDVVQHAVGDHPDANAENYLGDVLDQRFLG
jgi:hypothetical protein